MKSLLQTVNSSDISSKAMKQWKKLKHGRLIVVPGPLRRHTPVLKKTEVMCLLLHAVDVSHPTKDWGLHREWTARCMEEFFKQGDKEREMGLDISPLCDRDTTQVPQSQIGFIDYIVVPLFNTVIETVEHLVDRKDETDPWHLNLHTNKP